MSAIALNTSEAENEIILGKNLSAGRYGPDHESFKDNALKRTCGRREELIHAGSGHPDV